MMIIFGLRAYMKNVNYLFNEKLKFCFELTLLLTTYAIFYCHVDISMQLKLFDIMTSSLLPLFFFITSKIIMLLALFIL